MSHVRVFHLIKSLGRGGAETLLPEGIRFADRDRFDYSVGYFLPWKDAMVESLRDANVDVVCFGGRNNLRILLAARRVASEIRRRRIDVLHCHLPIAGIVGRIAGQLANVPVVYTEHNKQERYHAITRRLNRLTWGWQDRVVAVSGDVAGSIRTHIGSAVPVQVVLNGVDTERYRRSEQTGSEVRDRLGIPADAPVIGAVAVFRTQKRLQDWVEAARLILREHPTAHFLLVGDGPLRDEVRSAIQEAGCVGRIHLPGLQEDVRPYLAAMQVYMMSSIFEGLPVALLEAMAMECVPACTAVGGIPEAVTDGWNGVLTTPQRPDELARAVSTLLSDPEKFALLRSRARQIVTERFSMLRMTQELETLYVEVIRERQGTE